MHSELLDEDVWSRRTGHNRMVGMAKSPHSLFVYWEVDDVRRALLARHFCSSWDDLVRELCVYDVTDCWFDGYRAPLIQRIRVHLEDNWHIQGLSPMRNYVVDLATTSNQGALFVILRSNVVTLPPLPDVPHQPQVRFARWLLPTDGCNAYPYESQFDGYHVFEPGEGSR